MPTRRVKNSERRRCPRACTTCKRRKERCDGSQPCGRCVGRRVGQDCAFDSSARRLQLPLPSPNDTSSSHGDLHHTLNPLSSQGPGDDSYAEHLTPSLEQAFPSPHTAPVPQMSRLIQDSRGKFMYIGDAANLSFLQTIRRLISGSPWASPFADDPMRHSMVEVAPACLPDWIQDMIEKPPQKPDSVEARYFVRWYMMATTHVLNLFDETELHQSMSTWLESVEDRPNQDPMGAIFFLVLAIGAQVCPENRDDVAEKYFNYGRFMTVSSVMDDPGISTVQANVLITMYLLGASRRNAAFMALGTAVRAAYALGIHRSDTNAFFDPAEYTLRERLWKVLRALDMFMSASLGRPPSTLETRNTTAGANYSATTDLCAIFETILTQVYSKRMVSTELVENISQHHRQWTARFTRGLDADGIRSAEFISAEGGSKIPNIGLYHLKEAYYWTIMLLARPFLVESVSKTLSRASTHIVTEDAIPQSPSDQVLSHACVDSAIRTVDLLRGLVSANEVPKRLPFVVNSLFVSGLVLGLAHFGDSDRVFPLGETLTEVQKLLSFFSPHDAVANRNVSIIKSLQTSCQSYLDHRARQKMARQNLLIGGLFGTVHGDSPRSHVGGPKGSAGEGGQGTFQAYERISPPDTDADGLDQIWEGNTTDNAPRAQATLDPSDTLNSLSGLGSITDAMLSMSPRTLMFDSFDDTVPLFSTVDGSLLQFGNDSTDETSDLGCAG